MAGGRSSEDHGEVSVGVESRGGRGNGSGGVFVDYADGACCCILDT